jgi:hypothetical protein
MDKGEVIKVKLSKLKHIILLVIALVFILLGFWVMVYQSNYSETVFTHFNRIKTIGLINVLVFMLFGLYLTRKIADTTPGLIISDKGLQDNSNEISAGFVPWADVKEIKKLIEMNQPFIAVMVQNPNEYLKKQQNSIHRKEMDIRNNLYLTPIVIPLRSLRGTTENIIAAMQSRLDAYRRQNKN